MHYATLIAVYHCILQLRFYFFSTSQPRRRSVKAFVDHPQNMARHLHILNNMRVAISIWQNCISPVFDVAENILLIDIVDNQVASSTSVGLGSDQPFTRAKILSDWGVSVLICGAISQTLKMAVSGQNIEIISYVFGPLETILSAYINGQLQDGCNDAFPDHKKRGQPKCYRNRRRNRGNNEGF